MKILYVYGWTTENDFVYTLRKLGYEVDEYFEQMDDHWAKEDEIAAVVSYVREHNITHLMSVHLLYNLSVAAYQTNTKYISIIWDSPYLKMYTIFGKLENVWVSTFDRLDCERFQAFGTPHVIYQPLTVNKDDVLRWDVKKKLNGNYFNDISFVGRLYERNLYDRYLKEIPENMQEYFTSIIEEAAFKWDGIDRVYGKVDKEIIEYIKLVSPGFVMENPFDIEDERCFETYYLIRKIANVERICCLNFLAEQHMVSFYTDSKIQDGMLSPNIKLMPPVEAGEAISIVYAGSKINLNMALKGMEGATPRRILDIMGAGGFMLSSYCEETAQLFEEDKEIVMFRTPEELLGKVDYYLAHDREREKIADAGQRKVLEFYTHERKFRKLMEWVEEKK